MSESTPAMSPSGAQSGVCGNGGALHVFAADALSRCFADAALLAPTALLAFACALLAARRIARHPRLWPTPSVPRRAAVRIGVVALGALLAVVRLAARTLAKQGSTAQALADSAQGLAYVRWLLFHVLLDCLSLFRACWFLYCWCLSL